MTSGRRSSRSTRRRSPSSAKKLEPEFWDTAFTADKDCAKKMIDGGMQLVTPSAAMMADLRKRCDHLMADFMKKVPSSQAPIKAFLAEVKRGLMHGGPNPNAGGAGARCVSCSMGSIC